MARIVDLAANRFRVEKNFKSYESRDRTRWKNRDTKSRCGDNGERRHGERHASLFDRFRPFHPHQERGETREREGRVYTCVQRMSGTRSRDRDFMVGE